MLNIKIKKRFIAGAQCQHCGATDTLQLLIDGKKESVSCLDCGHSMSKPQENKTQQKQNIITIVQPE